VKSLGALYSVGRGTGR